MDVELKKKNIKSSSMTTSEILSGAEGGFLAMSSNIETTAGDT